METYQEALTESEPEPKPATNNYNEHFADRQKIVGIAATRILRKAINKQTQNFEFREILEMAESTHSKRNWDLEEGNRLNLAIAMKILSFARSWEDDNLKEIVDELKEGRRTDMQEPYVRYFFDANIEKADEEKKINMQS